jgi:hypothetical protein
VLLLSPIITLVRFLNSPVRQNCRSRLCAVASSSRTNTLRMGRRMNRGRLRGRKEARTRYVLYMATEERADGWFGWLVPGWMNELEDSDRSCGVCQIGQAFNLRVFCRLRGRLRFFIPCFFAIFLVFFPCCCTVLPFCCINTYLGSTVLDRYQLLLCFFLFQCFPGRCPAILKTF